MSITATYSNKDIFDGQRTASYAALAVVNAVVTSLATAASPVVLTGAGLTGSPYGNGASLPMPQTVTVTTASHAGSYIITTPITIKGTDINGTAITDTLTLTQVNGGETIVGVKGFASVTEIDIPAMNDTSGSWQFGVQDVINSGGWRALRVGGAGNLKLGFLDGATDTVLALNSGDLLPVIPYKVFGSAATTATNLTFIQ